MGRGGGAAGYLGYWNRLIILFGPTDVFGVLPLGCGHHGHRCLQSNGQSTRSWTRRPGA